ncbi:MAG: protein rep [Mesoflavibacter sp.]|nr:protein rep [Mesoflavibacter sp.]
MVLKNKLGSLDKGAALRDIRRKSDFLSPNYNEVKSFRQVVDEDREKSSYLIPFKHLVIEERTRNKKNAHDLWVERGKTKESVKDVLNRARFNPHLKENERGDITRALDRLENCMRFAGFYECRHGNSIKAVAKRCYSRVCPHCVAKRAQMLQEKFIPLIEMIIKNPKALILTIKNVPNINKNVYKQQLRANWNKLKEKLKVKYELRGGIDNIETTYNSDENSKSYNTWHPHLHILLDWREDEVYSDNEIMEDIRKLWYEITGDSHQIDFKSVKDGDIKELFKYNVKFQDKVPYDEYLIATKHLRLIQGFGSCFKYGDLLKKIEEELNSEVVDVDSVVDTHEPDSPEPMFIANCWVTEKGVKKIKYIKHRKCPCCGEDMILKILNPTGELVEVPDHLSLERYVLMKDRPPEENEAIDLEVDEKDFVTEELSLFDDQSLNKCDTKDYVSLAIAE